MVLSGAAAEFESEMPFSVWVDALDAYVVSQDFAGHVAWDEELAAELQQVLPSLARSNGRSGAIADERYRAHRAVSRLLRLIADDQPLVLILDDLHWERRRLARADRCTHTSRAQGAGTARSRLSPRAGCPAPRHGADRPAGPPARAWTLTRSRGDTPAGRDGGQVRGRDLSATGEAIRSTSSSLGAPATTLCWRLRSARTPTSPECPRPWRAQSRASSGPSPIPPARCWDAAAVAGDPFELDLAAEIGGLPEAASLSALDDLLDHDLVRPTHLPRRFSFRHPLVRRAVYDSVRGGRRLAGHARAAEALAARGADSAERAHHVEQSARQGDEEAIRVLLEAGQTSSSRAPSAAARWFAAAMHLLPSADIERQVSVRMDLASAQRSLGEFDPSSATLLEAMDLLPPDAVAERVELTTLCAAVEHWGGTPRGGAPSPRPCVGGGARPLLRRGRSPSDRALGRRLLRVRLRSDARHGAGSAGDRARRGRRGAHRRGRLGALHGRSGGREDRGRAEASRRGGQLHRPPLRCGAGAAPGGAVPPRVGRELPRVLRPGDRPRGPRDSHRAGDRPRTDGRADDAGEGIPVRDAGAHGRGHRDG